MMILLSSCVSPPATEQKRSIKNLIVSEQCYKPCWLGIEVGQTIPIGTIEKNLQSFYGKQNAHVFTEAGKNPTILNHVVWGNSEKSDIMPVQSGTVGTDKNSNQVKIIDVWFDEQWYTVGDLISTIGSPELALMINFNNYPDGSPCDVWKLYYPQIGLSVIIWQGENEKIGNIETQDHIVSLYFSEEWQASDTAYNKYYEKLVEWNGYGDYSSNCAEVQ